MAGSQSPFAFQGVSEPDAPQVTKVYLSYYGGNSAVTLTFDQDIDSGQTPVYNDIKLYAYMVPETSPDLITFVASNKLACQWNGIDIGSMTGPVIRYYNNSGWLQGLTGKQVATFEKPIPWN